MIYVIYKFIKVTYIISYIVYMYTYNVYVIGQEGTNGGKEENQWRDMRLIWGILTKYIIYIYKSITMKPLFYMISIS